MSLNQESSSPEGRSLPIAFPLDPSPIMFYEELADKYGPQVFLDVLKANINYLKECADAASRLYVQVGKILDEVKPETSSSV